MTKRNRCYLQHEKNWFSRLIITLFKLNKIVCVFFHNTETTKKKTKQLQSSRPQLLMKMDCQNLHKKSTNSISKAKFEESSNLPYVWTLDWKTFYLILLFISECVWVLPWTNEHVPILVVNMHDRGHEKILYFNNK